MRGNFPPPGDPLHSGIKLISSVSPVLLADSSPSEPSWKPLLNEQCKEAEENNRMGKTRDLFKKTGEIKGTFPAKMGTMKDRSCKELTEEEIKKSKALFSLSLSLSLSLSRAMGRSLHVFGSTCPHAPKMDFPAII